VTDERGARPDVIAGVVGNARERGIDRAAGPVVYMCNSGANPTPFFLVRTAGDPASVAQAVRMRVKELEPLRAVYDVSTLDDRLGGYFAEHRLRMLLLAFFAATALSLTAVGLYGTLSYAVNVRRREIGLRLALGALRRDILRQFLSQGLRVAGIACACGLAASIGLARFLSNMLYGVSPSDPVTLVLVVAVVMIVAALAAVIPATRGALTEPVRALRQD
jgi:putative ABC transport system permease protein